MHRKNGPDKAFYFKQFHIHHDRCAMKVGTDGVLLGSWADVHHKKYILDIGTGSGLIALMLAQRSPDQILINAVEINSHAYEQALENVAHSPWSHRISVTHSSIQGFHSGFKFDMIVCNPPFFSGSTIPADQHRAQSRHTGDLTFLDLISSVKRLMQPNGRFSLVLPKTEAEAFTYMAARQCFFISRKWLVRTRSGKPVDRLLIELAHGTSAVTETGELTIQHENGEWTAPYLQLVSPFYPWAVPSMPLIR